MPNSFQQHTANGSTTVFSASQIDGYLSVNDIYVYVNDVLKTAGTHYSLQTSPSLQITFLAGNTPAFKDEVRIQRSTPKTSATRAVDFADGSVLNASDLDKSSLQLLFITQEAEDLGSGALGKQFDQLSWNAETLPITGSTTGASPDSLTTKEYVDAAVLYGGGAINPQAWSFSGDGATDTFSLNPVANATNPAMFLVEVAGTLLRPTQDYTFPTTGLIQFSSAPAAGSNIRVRNFGVSRNLNESVSTAMMQDDAVTTVKILDANVTAAKLAADSVETAKIVNLNVTTGKLADLSVTTGKLADLNVTTGKIADLNVTTGKLADGSVTSTKLDANIAVSGTLSVAGQATFGSVNQSLIGAQFSDTNLASVSLVEATSIPSWARRIVVSFANVSTSGTNPLLLRVGSGSFATAGYSGRCLSIGVSSVPSDGTSFPLTTVMVAANFYSGVVRLDRVNTAGSYWAISGQFGNDSANVVYVTNGAWSFGASMIDRVRAYTTDTFDGGRIAISWE